MTTDGSRAMDAAALRAALRTEHLGRAVESHASMGSTNDRALDLLGQGAAHGTLVLADAQTAGRGRRGHAWHSPPGLAIHASLVLRGERPLDSPALLVAAAGLGIAEGIEAAAPVSAGIKWPNDVWIRGRKVAGILVEARGFRADAPCFVLGFGINVLHAPSDFPAELRATATSLAMEAGATAEAGHPAPAVPTREVVLRAVLEALEPLVACALGGVPAGRASAASIASIHTRYRDRSVLLGRRVTLLDGDVPLTGVVADLSAADGLLLRTADGVLRHVRAEHAAAVVPL
jgi:BirA family biotin operon repressor/biotin-[acetyl-CoA-carboxylase] ligase